MGFGKLPQQVFNANTKNRVLESLHDVASAAQYLVISETSCKLQKESNDCSQLIICTHIILYITVSKHQNINRRCRVSLQQLGSSKTVRCSYCSLPVTERGTNHSHINFNIRIGKLRTK